MRNGTTKGVAKTTLTEQAAGDEQDVRRHITKDREMFSSFVKNLNKSIKVEDMGEELQKWWTNRY